MAEAEGPVPRGHHSAAGVVAPAHEDTVSYKVAARSQSRLHNFSFPSMSWGSHRLLRCIKVDPHAVSPSAHSVPTVKRDLLKQQGTGASATPRRREGAEEDEAHGGGDGKVEGEDERLQKFRDAMKAEFQKPVDRIPTPQPFGFRREERKEDLGPSPPPAREEASRPWNLRLRRAAAWNAQSAEPENGEQKAKTQDQRQSLMAPEKRSAAANYSGRIRRWEEGPEEEERPTFSPVLSKEEIEEDFFLMTGSKPPRRPKKRPRNVQKQIEVLYPGFYLTEITPDLYRTS